MALHVLIFKLMDIAWVHVFHAGGGSAAALPDYPCSFPAELGILYHFAGIVIPALLCLAAKKITGHGD